MADYRIVAATPKKASNHLNAKFKVYELTKQGAEASLIGWKSIHEVSDLI